TGLEPELSTETRSRLSAEEYGMLAWRKASGGAIRADSDCNSWGVADSGTSARKGWPRPLKTLIGPAPSANALDGMDAIAVAIRDALSKVFIVLCAFPCRCQAIKNIASWTWASNLAFSLTLRSNCFLPKI